MLSHGLRTVLESIWAQTKENRRYWDCKLLNFEISTRQKKGKRSPSSTKMLPVATPLDNLTHQSRKKLNSECRQTTRDAVKFQKF